ncbi:MAG TPA: hypothetical protein VK946_01310 [Methylotenera sp.]|nr:hypothetical protein [Methylotenera sp.]
MIWKALKLFISAICLFVATLALLLKPFSFINVGIASLFTFLAAALWIDYTKPQGSQNITPTQRSLAKIAIGVLVIIFIIMFISSFFTSDVHVNSRGFVQIITALLKAL